MCVYILAFEAQSLGKHSPQVAPIYISTNCSQGFYFGQSLRHFERSNVAGVPYFVARVEVETIFIVPIAVRVANNADTFHVRLNRFEVKPHAYKQGEKLGSIFDTEQRRVNT